MRIHWYIPFAAILWCSGAPAVQSQDFLKQLEERISQKQQEAKSKEPLPPETPPSAQPPIDFPADSEGLPAPVEPAAPMQGVEGEVLELPPPNNPPALRNNKSPARPSRTTPPSPFPPKPAPTPAKPVRPIGGGGFLGLTVDAIPGGGFGLTVVEVVPDSPAWKAGFKNGDRVIGVGGQAVSTTDAFAEQLNFYSPGSPVKFLVERRGRTANLVAVLQDRTVAGQIHGGRPGTALELTPPTDPAVGNRQSQAYFGINVADMSEAFRRQFAIPAFRGASVTEVIPNSPAEATGLKPGDCIVEIEGNAVQSAATVMETILRSKPGQVITLSYYRGRQLNTVSVGLASDMEMSAGPIQPNNVTPDMLTPEYVAGLQNELDRVHQELNATQTRLQQLEARLQSIESAR